MRTLKSFAGWVTVCALLIGLTGCGVPPKQSTRLTSGDYVYTISRTQQQLIESDLFKGRTSDSPKMTVTIDRVTNLTTDIIPEGEQWGFVSNVWSNPDVQRLARSKNIVTQIRPEVMERHQLKLEGAGAHFQPPTHLMTAEFNSATRAQRDREGYHDQRVELYQMIYQMTELKTGQVVWNSSIAFKRQADGQSQN